MSDIYRFCTLADVAASINEDEPLAFDTETIGLYGTIRLAQFYQKSWPQVLIVDRPNPWQLVAMFAARPKCNLVMQNAAYDVSTMQTQTGSRFIPETFNDTLLLGRLAFPNLESFSLDSLISYVLAGKDPYKDAGIDKKAMHKADWSVTILDPLQVLYAALDVYYLLDLYDSIKAHEEDLSYKVDLRALRRALDFQNNGFAVDRTRLEQRYAANLQRLKEINLPINSNSYKQVRPYIGSENSDGLGLAKLALTGNDKAAAVREDRTLKKQNSFLDKFVTPDGRIYGRFAPSARSGRFTCKDQNLQQLPRATKDCFGVPEGRVLVYSDYAQLELRTIAAITGDQVLLGLLRAGKDPHGYVAEQVFGANWTARDRQVTKTINFNALYGGGAPMLQSILLKDSNIWLEEDEVRRIMRRWKRIFGGIASWQEEGIRSHRRGSYKQTPFGRKYRGKLLTDHLNIENQGFGADVAKLALHYMYDDLKANDAELVNFIHDSYLVEMADDPVAYKKVCKLMAEAMKEAWFEASKISNVTDIPMPVEVGVGHNWGDIEAGNTIYKLEA